MNVQAVSETRKRTPPESSSNAPLHKSLREAMLWSTRDTALTAEHAALYGPSISFSWRRSLLVGIGGLRRPISTLGPKDCPSNTNKPPDALSHDASSNPLCECHARYEAKKILQTMIQNVSQRSRKTN